MRPTEEMRTTADPHLYKVLQRASKSEQWRIQRDKTHRCGCGGRHNVHRWDRYKNHRRCTDPTKWHCSACKYEHNGRSYSWGSNCGFPDWEMGEIYNTNKDIYVYLCEEPFNKFCTPERWFGKSGEVK